MKKEYESPYILVIDIEDVITTSTPFGDNHTDGDNEVKFSDLFN